MQKRIYISPEVKVLRMDIYEDIANGNLLINSRETTEEQLGKRGYYDPDIDWEYSDIEQNDVLI